MATARQDTIKTDLCVIGAGSGGLSVAAGAAQMGARVVLVEKHKMGGDCLNYGCVPSKALLAAGHAAAGIRASGRFGVNGHEPAIDFAAVGGHVRDVIAGIAPHDSVERFESLGVTVLQGAARFTGPRAIEVGGRVVNARRFVVATGSSPLAPPIDGLDRVAYLTNETVFELKERPDHLLIIGGGPIGCEMAQAHRRLGARVTLLEAAAVLPRDDRDAAEVVRQSLRRDGVDIVEGARIRAVEPDGNGVAALIEDDGEASGTRRLAGSHLLVATGRRANVEGLGLDAAGVAHGDKGIEVDARLRTSNKRIFAVGDVAGGPQFTHAAGYHAGIVIRNALFHLPAKVDYSALPWVTYTAPELAQVGLIEREARERHGDGVRALRWDFAENDRARAERETDGFVKAITDRRGRILGATVVGRQAGELIQPWTLAIAQGLKIGALANMIAPYPTLGEAAKRAAGGFYTDALFGPRTRRLVRLLQWF